MKQIILLYLFIISFNINAQNEYQIINNFPESYYPMQILSFTDIVKDSEGNYHINIQSPIPFSAFGVGWNEPVKPHHRGDFSVEYRVKKNTSDWTEFKEDDAFVSPKESPTAMYWTNVLFGIDEFQHNEIDVYIKVPADINLSEIRLSIMDMSKDVDVNWKPQLTFSNTKDCPEFPAYIARSGWCGSYTACHNPTYAVSTIYPTHTVIHHGASPNEYTDGAAVARSYWNYHVNTLGWSDIGYNYLTDKFGNLYQGRHNLNLPNTDVRGAHAGASNTYSIGINFMGNADVTTPTTVQLEKCEQFLAWWYNYRGFDPTTTGSIVLQSGGTESKYRICGHKDVNVGGTTCPGTVLYGQLPSIRTATKAIIDACSTPSDIIAPTSVISVDANLVDNWRGTDFWTDYSDYDNTGGSGVNQTFYQIIDYNGSEWRGNPSEGFFNDNFSTAINPEWTSLSGTWQIDNGHLQQTDESLSNPNIYAAVNQTANNTYLYHFQGYFDGNEANRRIGLYFFCSNPTGTHRGNGYMVWFRVDDDKYQLYRCKNDTISSPLVDLPISLNPQTWYDFKITYNPATGIINSYVNNALVGSWTDTAPFQTGSHISLRTGNCLASYDDIKVRRTRTNHELVTVGNLNTKQSRYQSPDNQQEACRINSLINDVAGNWSTVSSQNVFVDWTLPSTSSSINGTWQTNDFNVDFNDIDALSGINKSFYQVIDFNGTEWRANAEAGFFSDNFENTLHADWTQKVGTWNVTNNELIQSNESVSNSNVYAYLKQDLSNRYLYDYDMKIETNFGTNRRGGFHFMCDNPDSTNRNNSYFIWFRVEQQTLEFYKVYNNEFEQVKILPVNFQASTWYNVKTIFDRITGEMFVYLNNTLVGEWKDDVPFTTGDYISFRNGNSIFYANNLKVYRTRYPQVTVTTGNSNSFIRYQNQDSSSPAAKVKSIVCDKAHNLSDIYYQEINIDWTAPSQPTSVLDGIGSDIDTTYSLTTLSANWNASTDNQSEIASYWYAIGTSSGATDVINWTSIGNQTSFTNTNLNLVDQQKYYVSIKSENNAGLFSNITTSNGQVAMLSTSLNNQNLLRRIKVYPNPSSDFLNIDISELKNHINLISIYDTNGKKYNVTNNYDKSFQGLINLKNIGLTTGNII